MLENVMAKKKGVGALFLSKNTKEETVAILQIRGKWNTEKNAPESWPGACQTTVHGGLKEGEDFIQALLRETAEELGDEIVPVIQLLLETKKLKELINKDTPERQDIVYGAIVEKDVLATLLNKKKSSFFGGFKLVRRDNINQIVDLKKYDRITGVTDADIIAMFPDEKEAVRLAFEKLG